MKTEFTLKKLCDIIEECLLEHKLINQKDEETGEKYSLVDALTMVYFPIKDGKQEIENIVDNIRCCIKDWMLLLKESQAQADTKKGGE